MKYSEAGLGIKESTERVRVLPIYKLLAGDDGLKESAIQKIYDELTDRADKLHNTLVATNGVGEKDDTSSKVLNSEYDERFEAIAAFAAGYVMSLPVNKRETAMLEIEASLGITSLHRAPNRFLAKVTVKISRWVQENDPHISNVAVIQTTVYTHEDLERVLH